MGRLAGKVAFLTAAGAGIGRATALAFAREGARVIATDVSQPFLLGLEESGIAECRRLDVRDGAAVAAAARAAPDVDVLFNAAGFVHHGSVLECTEEEWDAAFDLNVKGMHRTITAFLPGMLAMGRGTIINVASAVGAAKAAPKRYAYGASKAAVVGLTKSVALDLITRGIRCNCICPGTVATPSLEQRIRALSGEAGGEDEARRMFIARQPMGRLGTAEEIAAVAVFLASDESAYMSGSAIVADGGFTL